MNHQPRVIMTQLVQLAGLENLIAFNVGDVVMWIAVCCHDRDTANSAVATPL